MIAALQRHEAGAGYKARNPTPLIKWHNRIIPRVHYKCRALNPRHDIEHVGLLESSQQLQGVIPGRRPPQQIVLSALLRGACVRHVYCHVELAIDRALFSPQTLHQFLMGVLFHDLLRREPARHSARYTTLGLAREQNQTSHVFRVLRRELDRTHGPRSACQHKEFLESRGFNDGLQVLNVSR